MPEEKWIIRIPRHRGYCPKYYENSYPQYGNKDQAASMQDISLRDPSALKPGPGIANLTAGDEDGAIKKTVKSILKTAVASNVAYGIGSNLLQKFSATAVTNAGIWPHTIVGTGVVTGEDVCHYQGKLLYSLNDTGAAGDIGSYNLATIFDDTYWTGTLSGTALANAVHQMLLGGDDVAYITNGRYIALLDDTSDNDKALDFWTDAVVASITWNYNRVIAGVNRPGITGVNANQSAVYRWNGYDSTWEGDPIEIEGRIGALLTKNGVTYIWYEEFFQGAARLTFGMLTGGSVTPLRTFSGTLPTYNQVASVGAYIIWMSGDDLLAWGPIDNEVQVDLFYLMTAKYSTTIGGIGAPFGSILIASDNGTNYSLGYESGYSKSASYKTIQFPTSGASTKSIVDRITINTDILATGARVDLTLRDNQETALWTDEMSYATDVAVTKKIFHPDAAGENFRLEFSHANGSTTNPVNIRETIIEGRNIV